MQLTAKRKITLVYLIAFMLVAMVIPPLTSSESSILLREGANPAYTPHEAILIDGNAELVAQATAELWPGNGTAAAPYLISGYYFYDITHSIEMNNVDLHWAVVGNEIDGPGDSTVWCGIEADNSSNGQISGNLFHNRFRGIWLIDVYNLVITGNTIQDNLFNGIECAGYINSCLISENTIRRCNGLGVRSVSAVDSEISLNSISDCDGIGIQVIGSSTNCEFTDNLIVESTSIGISLGVSVGVSVMHNRIINASGPGMYIRNTDDIDVYNNSILNGGDHGMDLREFSNSVVRNNSIVGCDGIGISILSGQFSTFQSNNVSSSSDYGMKTGASAVNMTVTRNMFYSNGASAQAADDGGDNLYLCNYWDDWVSPDADSNGFVDSPYLLEGTSANTDPYPLADPNIVPPIPTTTTGSGSSTGNGVPPVPLELVIVGAGAIIVLVVGVLFMKRRP